MIRKKVLERVINWRNKNISDKQLILILSVFIGISAGLAAIVIKWSVHLIRDFLFTKIVDGFNLNYIYIILPGIGLLLVVVFVRFINRKPVGHGIPSVLYSISKQQGKMHRHNLFSSIITSALTVGFGGSVGLEGPTVATGGAIGSNIGSLFNLSYRQKVLLIGCACAGAMSAIFKAPIAAVVFALEVIMLDLTLAAIVPLLISSASAILTSYWYSGQNFLYKFNLVQADSLYPVTESDPVTIFETNQIIYYIIFGVFTGLLAVYFTKTYMFVTDIFEKIKNIYIRLFIGGTILGGFVFLLPSLYGEGYEVINMSLDANDSFLYDDNLFYHLSDSIFTTIVMLLLVLLLKVVATSVTFGSGGVGGIFAPTLLTGSLAGLFFANLLEEFHYPLSTDPRIKWQSYFVLAGMAGMISAVIHAPLTAIFLIAEITGGYELFVPLMIVATISYATTRIFVSNSVYTIQLAKRGELMTHDKDKAALMMLKMKELIETDFNVLNPNSKLGDLVNIIKFAKRNIFPVVEENGTFRGIIKMDDIRHIMFNHEIYDKIYVRDLMFMPQYVISPNESMEDIAKKFQVSGRYNIAVIDKGKYIGFISRAKLFSSYRKILRDFSEE